MTKMIQHSVFEATAGYPIWRWNAAAQRERNREKIRQRAEAFINEIGVDSVISVSEHAPTFGPFSVVVWWYREISDTETPVIRAADENRIN